MTAEHREHMSGSIRMVSVTLSGTRPKLLLPDGRRVDSLRRVALYRELTGLRVPNITAAMTKFELMDAYEAVAKKPAALAYSLQGSGGAI